MGCQDLSILNVSLKSLFPRKCVQVAMKRAIAYYDNRSQCDGIALLLLLNAQELRGEQTRAMWELHCPCLWEEGQARSPSQGHWEESPRKYAPCSY